MAVIEGTNNDDRIMGGRGDDLIDGLDGDDRIIDHGGNNKINGGGGNDRIHAGQEVDEVDGGSGSDRIWTRHGDDTAIFRLSENMGANDYYDGGHGNDTLRLVLTAEESQDEAILQTIEALRKFFEDSDPKSSGQPPTTFTFPHRGHEANLTLRNFENLEVVVEGALPNVLISNAQAEEGEALVFSVTLDNAGLTDIVLDLATQGVSATDGVDYENGGFEFSTDGGASWQAAGGPDQTQVTIPAGATGILVRIDSIEDSAVELDETFDLSVATVISGDVDSISSEGRGTILNDDTVTYSVSGPVMVTEGTDSFAVYTVTQSGTLGAGQTVTVNYNTVVLGVGAGFAAAGSDFTAVADSLLFDSSADGAEQHFQVPILNDAIVENSEDFGVEISTVSPNASINVGAATTTIDDDDGITFSVSGPQMVTEGTDSFAVYTVTQSGTLGAGQTATVDYNTVVLGTGAGFAVAGSDFTAVADSLLFDSTADGSQQQFQVPILNDAIVENDEDFGVEISTASPNAGIDVGAATTTIADDDGVTFSVSGPQMVTEGTDSFAVYTVTQSGTLGAGQTATVNYNTVVLGTGAGFAAAGSDFTAVADSLIFDSSADGSQQQFQVPILNDAIVENDEDFGVEISTTSPNAGIDVGAATTTIDDDDGVTFSVSGPQMVTEGTDSFAVYTVTQSGTLGAGQTATVNYNTVVLGTGTGFAAAGSDFTAVADSLLFDGSADGAEQQFQVPILNDAIVENDEDFGVEISTASPNASINVGAATTTIDDDDGITFSVSGPVMVTEGTDSFAVYTVTQSGTLGAGQTATVNYNTVVLGTGAGFAAAGSDFTAVADSLLFDSSADGSQQQFQVPILNDAIVENDEDFGVEISTTSPNAGIDIGAATTTIDDDDGITFSVSGPVMVTEGTDNFAVYTVTQSGTLGAGQTATVNYNTVVLGAGTGFAAAGSDFTAVADSLLFDSSADGSQQQFQVPILNDAIVENDEDFGVEISTVSPNAGIDIGAATTTIDDDDGVTFSVSGPQMVTEGTDSFAVYTVTQNGTLGAGQSATVNYNTVVLGTGAGFAAAGSDFTAVADSLIFDSSADGSQQQFQVPILNDAIVENDEDFGVEISTTSPNAGIDVGAATTTIDDDDGVTFSVSGPQMVTEGTDSFAVYTVTQSGTLGAGQTATVNYNTVVLGTGTGFAAAGSDFTAVADSLLFDGSADGAEQQFQVPILNDAIVENDEDFGVEISTASPNASINVGAATTTIDDDDGITFSVSGPVMVTEGTDSFAVYTVTQSGTLGAGQTATVNYNTVVLGTGAGFAAAGSDFTAVADSLLFDSSADGSQQQFQVPILNDAIVENDEDFGVEISTTSPNAGIDIGAATTTIDDDDGITFSVSGPVMVTEGTDNFAVYTVTQSGTLGAGQTATVNYNTVVLGAGTGFAAAGSDFTAVADSLLFDSSADGSQQQFQVPILNDAIVENDEDFGVEISTVSPNAGIDIGAATTTIDDDDGVTFSVSGPQMVTEGTDSFAVYTVTQNGTLGAGQSATVNYNTVVLGTGAGFAAAGSDFTAVADSLIFDSSADGSQQQFQVPILNDAIVENDEDFGVEISTVSPNASINVGAATTTIDDDDDLLDLVVWTSSDVLPASIGIGGTLNVGSDISAGALTDHWTNGSSDQIWSTDGNWEDGTRPIATDRVVFDEVDSGGTNFVDQNIEITSLFYSGAGSHITDVINGSNLEVDSFVSVGIDNPDFTGSLRIEDVGVTAVTNAINIGQKSLATDTPVVGRLTLTSEAGFNLNTISGDVNIGFNQSNSGTATGELNALASGATVNVDVNEFIVGHANGTGAAQGTLRWNQEEAIHADNVYFGRGSNAISILDVPTGGTLRLGTDIARIGTLNLAYNDSSAAGSLTSALDFTVTNPTFEAYLSSSLTVGLNTFGSTGDTDGTLTLGSNSTLDMLSTTGDVNIGFNQSNSGTATGELNALASGATVNVDVNEFIVGHANGTGAAQGTLRWNQEEAIHADNVYFGRGSNAISILDVPTGGTLRLGTDIARIGTLNLAYNDSSAAGSLTSALDFTVTNPTFEAYLSSSLTVGLNTFGSTGDTDGTLTLGSNSTLDMLSTTGDVNIGFNQSNSGTATGELNALASGATVNVDVNEFIVGHANGTGAAQGTLRWNQEEAIHADNVYFGRGSNAISILDVPTGGTLRLGTDIARIGTLNLAYNDSSAAGSLTSALDFTVTNPTFEAYLSSSLTVGLNTFGSTGDTDGTLTLGSNSTLDMLSTTGDVNIGFNQSNSGTATGELNALASGATVNVDVNEFIVGHANGTGAAQGTLRWNQEEAIHADNVYFGRGSNAISILDVPTGGTLRLGTDIARIGTLNLAYNDSSAAGSLTSALDFTVTNPTFEAYLSSSLTVGLNTFGSTGDTDGTLTLGSNSTLDMLSTTGDVNIGFNQSNSGTATGELNALASGATVNVDVNEFIVGHANGAGAAQGTLRWNQEEAIHADNVYFGRGSNAISILDVPTGGTLRLGTDIARIGTLNLAYNDSSAAGSLTSALDFTVTNPTFEAYLSSSLTVGLNTFGSTGDTDGTLTLGSNSTLDMLSTTGDVNIGFNQSNSGTATGELNALASGATVNVDVNEFIVGHANGTGAAQGTLRWNQEEAIHADNVYFGRGSNAISILDVPTGGTLRLGTDIARIGTLNLAYNDSSAAGSLTSALDFTVTNPTFEAYLSSSLTVGLNTFGSTGDTDGTLTLGSNSTLDMLSTTGDVNIGFNQSNSGTATGELNALASGATVNVDVNEFIVGHANGTGAAQGTLRWNQEEAIHADNVYFGRGSNAISILDVPTGGTLRLGTDIARIGTLNLAYNDSSAAGSLTSALDFTVTNPTFEAYLSSSLTVGLNTFGSTGDTDGTLTLGSNSTLDMLSTTGDVNIGFNQSNSGTATGELNALASGATVNVDVNEFIVGHANGAGAAQGTLRWNQEEAIHADNVYFGRGSNAISILDVPTGGTLRLGTDIARIGTLNLAYNDSSAAGSLTSALDFTVTNPTFEAYLSSSLTVGLNTFGSTGDTDGTLTLGSNSTLDMLSTTGDVNIGFNQSNSGTATGELNALASGATVNVDVNEFIVGHANGAGAAQGTLRWNQEEAIHADNVYFGRGSNAISILDVPTGGTLRLGTDIARIGTLNLAYNDSSAAGSLTSALDFTVTNPTFEAYLSSSLTVGLNTFGSTGDTDGTLTLGSNSTLDMLSTTGDVNIGFNQSNSGTATGELNALASGATVNVDVNEFIVGHANGAGAAQGTLRWNQEEAIHADNVYFGRGSNAISILDVPTGGTLRLGTDIARIGTLNLAYNDSSAAGSLTSALDFTVTNPTFEAYLSSSLTVGLNTFGSTGDTDGTLTLGSNSTLDMLSTTGDVNIGFNQSNSGTATGELNATQGIFSADIDQFNVGIATGTGAAIGTFIMGDSASANEQINITANQVRVASGATATGTFDMRDGSLVVSTVTLGDNGTFLFTGGRLEFSMFTGTFDHDGGTFAPKNSPGISIINGDYNLSTPGNLEIEIEGVGAPGTGYDQLQVNGLVDFNSDSGLGGTLNVLLGFTPTIGSDFVIVENDDSDAITGTFNALPQLGTFNVINGTDTVTFQIDYAAGDGNDVALEVTSVAATAVTPLAALREPAQDPQTELTNPGDNFFVSLVADEDILSFENNVTSAASTVATAPRPTMFALTQDTAELKVNAPADDVTDPGTVLDDVADFELIGQTGVDGLSNDLYV